MRRMVIMLVSAATILLLHLGCAKEETPKEETLHSAVARGDGAVVRRILSQGADVDSRAPDSTTPLFAVALSAHSIQIAKLLIEHGASVNAVDAFNATPLHAAVFHADTAVANILLKAGADPTVRRQDGMTPIDLALESGHNLVVASCLYSLADRLAAQIKVPGWRRQAVLNIAAARTGELPEPRHAFISAERIPSALKKARQVRDDMRRAFILRGIAWSQAKAGDIRSALKTANEIKPARTMSGDPSPGWRAEVIAGIAAILEHPDIEGGPNALRIE